VLLKEGDLLEEYCAHEKNPIEKTGKKYNDENRCTTKE
jgi:hypothetical protein